MQWLPNLLTISNAFFGCLTLIFIYDYNLELITILIMASLLCDLFDGYLARKTGSDGELGKQLDSLADMISFGVVPGAIITKIGFSLDSPIFFLGFFVTLGSLYRLAKFNIEKPNLEYFTGLPTPANALMILGIAWGIEEYDLFQGTSNDQTSVGSIFSIFFIATIALSAYLMNSSLKILSFKSIPKHKKQLILRIIYAIISVILLIIFKVTAFAFIIPLFILFSLIERKIFKFQEI
jgi:CDP-diacylglycerol--serine O-phosphatidyltransferase|tara:strand:+ start:30108 stop:30818 length:711 start_codon:yes stop_codon:yes gene_type:complete